MTDKHKKTFSFIRKIIIIVAVCATIIGVCVTIFNAFGLWEKFHSLEAIQEWMASFGGWGLFVYGVLVLLQVIILPVPSTLTNLAAILVFKDQAWAIFFITTGCTIVGSYVCFFLGRFFGKKVVAWLVGAEKTEKYAQILEKKGNLLFILMMVLPCFPDDVLCMVAGLSAMKIHVFSIIILLTRPIMIALITFLGQPVVDALDTWGLPVSIGVLILILAAVIGVMFIRDKKDKTKDKSENIK